MSTLQPAIIKTIKLINPCTVLETSLYQLCYFPGKEAPVEPEGIPLGSISTSSAGSNDESSEIEEEEQQTADVSCCGKLKRVAHFFLETSEYRDPGTHGWRIKFRRLCLTLGVFFFSYSTIHSTISTQSYSSKHEIQKILVNLSFFQILTGSRIFFFRKFISL